MTCHRERETLSIYAIVKVRDTSNLFFMSCIYASPWIRNRSLVLGNFKKVADTIPCHGLSMGTLRRLWIVVINLEV